MASVPHIQPDMNNSKFICMDTDVDDDLNPPKASVTAISRGHDVIRIQSQDVGLRLEEMISYNFMKQA